MKTIWTIAKREYDNYFASPLAYVIAFAILFPIGIYFSLIMYFNIDAALYGGSAPDTTNVNWLFAFLMVFLGPALTMRLLSDEARMGTLELLLTSPVRDFELVAGKWLGAFLFILTLIAMTLIYPIILNNYITPGLDMRLLLASYIGLILVCAAMLGLGTGISAMFSNQFAAFFATLVIFFFMWFMLSFAGNNLPAGGEILKYLSLSSHFGDGINRGSIGLGDVVYYISLTALGLFAGSTAIEVRRWQ